MTTEMTRVEAMALTDMLTGEYLELLRVGKCVACEQLMQIREVDRSEVPPEREEAIRRVEELQEHGADGILEWSVTHSAGCRWFYFWELMPKLCEVMHIQLGMFEVRFKRGEGVMTEAVPLRVPGPGDPPRFAEVER